MNVSPNERIYRTLVKAAITLSCVPGLLFGYIWYANWTAESEARVFCERTRLGADIGFTVIEFEHEIGYRKVPGGKVSVRHYGFPEQGFAKDKHTFLFNGFMFDKAYCDVSLNPDGKIIGKQSFILYD